MPFALLIIGIVLIVVAVRGTQETFVQLVAGDFSGPGNFFYWVAALVLVGAVGYIPKLKPVSDGLLVAILLGLILSRGNPKFPGGGFFQQFQDALSGTETKAGTPAGPAGTILGSIGAITNPSTWTTQPNGEVWSPTGNFLPLRRAL